MNRATLQSDPLVEGEAGVILAELVDEYCDIAAEAVAAPLIVVDGGPSRRSRWWPIVATCRMMASAAEWLFGGVTIIGGLAILAAIPILQFLSLGYLLEAAGRIGKTGKFSARIRRLSASGTRRRYRDRRHTRAVAAAAGRVDVAIGDTDRSGQCRCARLGTGAGRADAVSRGTRNACLLAWRTVATFCLAFL